VDVKTKSIPIPVTRVRSFTTIFQVSKEKEFASFCDEAHVSAFPSLRLPIPGLDAGATWSPPPSPDNDDIAVRLRAYWDSLVVEDASVVVTSERERASWTDLSTRPSQETKSRGRFSCFRSRASLSTLER